ncbi:helix-turn-helix domain-containing protein [Paenibacillus hodogayensis]|uniref:Helix-turn-helix domain-containing protein n=1 Tax=Paenibacillus hodogayensis TaxID=279208 RepID=A0ABV5VYJ8_9BACL
MHINRLNRIQLSYLPVFFVIGISLLFIAYLTLTEVTKQSAYKANEILSRNIALSVDDSLKAIDDAINRQLLDHEMVKRFFQPDPLPDRSYWDYRTVAALNEMLAAHELIDSVYLYRTSDNKVLGTSMFAVLDDFGDKEFVGKQLSSLKPFRWTEGRLFRERPDDRATGVISLAKYANLSNRSLVVVNVSIDRLNRLIRDMTQSGLNYIELLDSNGKLIASRDGTDKPALLPAGPEGGKEWSNVRLAYTGWTVRSGVYQGSLVQWITSLFYVWIALGFLVIAAGLVWLIVVTRRNYRPIQSISRRIAEHFRQKPQEDDLKYIETAIEELFDQSSVLLEQNKENLAYRKRYMFKQLLEGAVAGSADGWKEEIERFSGSLERCRLLVAVAEIDGYGDFAGKYTKRDQYLLKLALDKAVQEIAEAENLRIWPEWVDRDRFGLLLLLDEETGADSDAYVMLDKLIDWVRKHLPYTVTIGIGPSGRAAADIPESYEGAREALDFKTSLGANRAIRSADFAAKPPFEMLRQVVRVRAIGQSFRTGDGEWERHWDEMFGELRQQLFSRDDLTGLLHYFLYQLHKEMSELPEEFQAVWNGGAHTGLSDIVGRQESLETIRESGARVLREASDRMRRLRESKPNHQLIRKVKQYISEHYANPDLSHAHLESEFGLSASYLSRLFKEEFGVKFIDYLTQTRMEQATVLLKQHPDKTIQAIAEQVGYMHGITFIRAFKKSTGSTPGIFRKNLN